jgi:hypothetical protein
LVHRTERNAVSQLISIDRQGVAWRAYALRVVSEHNPVVVPTHDTSEYALVEFDEGQDHGPATFEAKRAGLD